MSQEIQAKVQAILDDACVTFSASLRGETKRDDWVCDEWRVALTKDNRTEIFEYFTGVGLRKLPPWTQHSAAGYDNGPPPRPGTLLHEQWMKQAKPQAPTAADVLYSLLSDSEDLGQSFESWCGDFGYDSDSRKAEATYLACQRNGDKLATLFTPKQLAELRAALEGY